MQIPRVYIRPPLKPGPRKLPRGVAMSQSPKPLYHSACKTRKLYQFADGQHWCETCGKYVEVSVEGAPVRKAQGVTWTTKVLK